MYSIIVSICDDDDRWLLLPDTDRFSVGSRIFDSFDEAQAAMNLIIGDEIQDSRIFEARVVELVAR